MRGLFFGSRYNEEQNVLGCMLVSTNIFSWGCAKANVLYPAFARQKGCVRVEGLGCCAPPLNQTISSRSHMILTKNSMELRDGR